ncbi:PhzF family phenazine biosynthesis protein [bacterium]|jgi:PhzF family phenazine biosynthesis protein|nr:PhzF family phenazine biosynthesis protein [bacterium]
MKIWIVNAFTDESSKGNPAAVVVVEEFPTELKMQEIAFQMNLSETCFVKNMGPGKYCIRWFTPTVEVELCGHATLAAGFILKTYFDLDLNVIRFESKGGPLTVEALGAYYSLTFDSDEMRDNVVEKEIMDALGDNSVRCSVKGKSDDSFLVYVYENPQSIRNLRPNFLKLTDATSNAVIVTSKGDLGYDYILRVFAPQYGINEDPVTGSAQILLAEYWSSQFAKKNVFNVEQASSRSGSMLVTYLNDSVSVSGKCILVSELNL